MRQGDLLTDIEAYPELVGPLPLPMVGPRDPRGVDPDRCREVLSLIRRTTICALVVLLLGSAGGCRGGDPAGSPTPPPASTISPSPSVDPSIAAATTQILARYRGYQNAYRAAAAAPNADDSALRKYIGDPLLTQVRQDLRLLKANGLVRQGTPHISPAVNEVQLTATPAIASIQDCYDVGDVHVINKATGKSADAPNQATRYRVTSRAKFFGGSTGWLIVQSDADRNSTC